MKKTMLILGLCGISALTACSNNNNATEDIYKESGNTINVNDDRAELYDRKHDNVSEDFGYTRHQRSPVMGTNSSSKYYAAIDREQISDIIGKYCTTVPKVDDVSTLVTDEEVLIVYQTDSNNRNQTADQVKKMAMSVVPRWYHVYVSDDTSLRKNVESYATMDSDSKNIGYGVDQIIKKMLKSPQGLKMSNGENANGETQGEMNDDLDNDDIGEHSKKYNKQEKTTGNDADDRME